ncbi:MAG TPA: hypothetical protein VMP01_01815 [Pirellulaceae bacterium]|nr:hypothetical protein [Pirellulaceae bacterium]
MRRIITLAALPLAMAVALYLAGCNRDAGKTDGDKAAEKEHDHDHEHHAHGPHGGALVELGDDEKYHAEWVTEESGKVTVWILDGAGEKEVPIAAEKVTIETTDPKGEASFDLAAVNRTEGDMPTAFQFEIEGSQGTELLGILEALGGDITATLKADINGDVREGKIEKHEHKH